MNQHATSTPEARPLSLRLHLPNEASVLGFVLGTVLVTEMVMRIAEPHLSLDLLHLQQLKNIVVRLDSQKSENSRTVLVVGNSLVREGIQPELFQQTASEQLGNPVVVERIHPDNTALAEWYYAIDRFALSSNRLPDAVVLVFQGGHLRDAPSRHVNELGRYYCGPNQLEDLAAYDLRTLEQWLSYGLSSLSSSLSNHERVERRALDGLLPNYRNGIQELNRRSQSQNSQTENSGSYRRLSSLIQSLHKRQIAMVLVEIPIENPIPIDPELEKLLTEKQVLLVKASQSSRLTQNDFTDGMHMNAIAAGRYSQELAKTIKWRVLFQTSSSLPTTSN